MVVVKRNVCLTDTILTLTLVLFKLDLSLRRMTFSSSDVSTALCAGTTVAFSAATSSSSKASKSSSSSVDRTLSLTLRG